MRGQARAKFRKRALLCVILGAHLLLFWLISVSDNPRSVRRSEEAPGILFWVDLPKPRSTQPSTRSSSERPISTHDPPLNSSAARDNTITLPPEIEGTDAPIDWDAEARRVARDVARRKREEEKFRSLDHHPAGMGPLLPKPSGHKLGDSEHFAGGEIIDWINSRCYYSNQNAPTPALGPALRLQIPVCKATSENSLPSLEDWKKEQANR